MTCCDPTDGSLRSTTEKMRLDRYTDPGWISWAIMWFASGRADGRSRRNLSVVARASEGQQSTQIGRCRSQHFRQIRATLSGQRFRRYDRNSPGNRLIGYTRVSTYGQTAPTAATPSYARMATRAATTSPAATRRTVISRARGTA